MKRLLATLLVMAMLLSVFGGLKMEVNAAATDITPFTMVNWNSPDKEYANVFGMPKFLVDRTTLVNTGVWEMRWSGTANLQTLAANLKAYMSEIPEGSRFIQVATYSTFLVKSEHVIYLDEGVALLRNWLDSFLAEYKAIGGELDGIALDTEYNSPAAYYLFSEQYATGNTQIYQQIQDHPLYATEVRPMLVERGFEFYEGSDKSELYYLHNDYAESHADSQLIWNKVMNIRKAQYQNEAIYEPLMKYYPDALVSDYNVTNTYAWLKTPGDHGDTGNAGGNLIEVGNTSNIYTYAHRPSLNFIKNDGAYPPGYNKAVIEDNAFDGFLWDMRVFKDAQAASDEDGNFNAWVTYYDYRIGKPTRNANTVSGTPYHTETLYHIGLLNPQPFLGYVIPSEIATDTGTSGSAATAEYNKRIQNISDILSELTRVVGASDRKPIEYAGSWNSDFVISGMYAGGRNVWRISPDTTKGMTLEQFQVEGAENPTFYINGQTVIFPEGTILEETKIEPYGSCGYWVETPVDVEPVVINDKDRHSKYPAYEETFSNALLEKHWAITGTAAVQDGVLALSSGAMVNNTMIPARITAGDSYAKQQAWEVTFTISSDLATATLLSVNSNIHDGFKVSGGKLQYSDAGTYKTLTNITANTAYTLRREVNFVNKTSSYYVYSATGSEIASAVDVSMVDFSLPAANIIFSVNSSALLLDDYKLYPMGVTADFEVYDAATGYRATEPNSAAMAYRLSWMNASDEPVKAMIFADRYDSSNQKVSSVLVREFVMLPGADGVETEILSSNEGESVMLSLRTEVCPDADCQHVPTTKKDVISQVTCYTAGVEEVITYCPACNTILSTQTLTVPATGHSLTQVAAKAPTYAGAGWHAYEYCSACDYTTKVEIAAYDSSNRQNIMNGIGVLFDKANTADAALVYYGGANPWSVIGYNGDGVASAAGNMTLFSRVIYDVNFYNGSYSVRGNTYADSWVRDAVESVAAEYFSAAELAAIEPRDLELYTEWSGDSDATYACDGVYGTKVADAALWPLSTNEGWSLVDSLRKPFEAFTYIGSDGAEKTTYWYWFRSPGAVDSTTSVAYMRNGNHITIMGGHAGRAGVVPAFNLNPESVLFTSAAVGGKAVGGINALTGYEGNEWKLTVKDTTRNFEVTKATAKNDVVTVAYTGAKTGNTEYISVLIADETGLYTHYGRVAAVTAADGTVAINLSDIDMTGKTLHVFNEQYNGDKMTDYASELVVVTPEAAAQCDHANAEKQADCTVAVTCPDCGEVAHEAKDHTPGDDDGDCTTAVKCTVCGEDTTAAKESHTGGTATCKKLAECENCGKEYGKLADHKYTVFVETVEPTVSTTGYTVYKCEGCELTENRDATAVKAVPTINIDGANVTLTDEDDVFVQMGVTYLGVNSGVENVTSWGGFTGLGGKALSGKAGYTNLAAEKTVTLAENGDYVFYVIYKDGNKNAMFFQLVTVTAIDNVPDFAIDGTAAALDAKGNTIIQSGVKYVGADSNVDIADVTSWGDFAALAGKTLAGKTGYTNLGKATEATLSENGDYIFYVIYKDAAGTKTVFIKKTVVLEKPDINVADGTATLVAHGYEIVQSGVKYVGEDSGVDVNAITTWGDFTALRGEALNGRAGYTNLGKAVESKLANAGDYIFYIIYKDANGTKTVFVKKTVESEKPVINVIEGAATLVAHGYEIVQSGVKYVGANANVDITDVTSWGDFAALEGKALNGRTGYTNLGKATESALANAGDYVFYVIYKDANGVARTIFYMVTV